VFGGNLARDGDVISVTPLNSSRSRVYIAPFGLWITLDSGNFQRLEVNRQTGLVRLGLAPADPFTSKARLRVEQPAKIETMSRRPTQSVESERGAWVVPLSSEITWIDLPKP
jgi:hypothetical protein